MHMKNTLRLLMLSALATAVAPVMASDYTCVELELFAVDKNNIDDRESARAAMIPVEVLTELRTYIAVEIPLEMGRIQVKLAPEETCPNDDASLVFGGTVTDYKKGNQVARYFVGLGAGKQKFAVDAWVKRKGDGVELKRGEVVDRKIGGLIGGSKDKGKQDFGEKIADFIHGAATGRDQN
jgi:hypothetical protein